MTGNSGKQLKLFAPVSGKTVAIENVPDPVFADKMVGDGISVDPTTSVLVAPCAGVVANIHSAHHALTISTPEGADVLMHIGLETVMLKGKGFNVKVHEGQSVETGTPLIEFDADFVAANAKSLLTEIVITNTDRVSNLQAEAGKEVRAGRDVVLIADLTEALPEHTKESTAEKYPLQSAESWTITIPNVAGLHARPTAVLVNAAKKYAAEISLVRGDEKANLKSIVGVMGLDVKKGDKVVIKASGVDAVEALKELIVLMESGSGEDPNAAPELPQREEAVVLQSVVPNVLAGIPSSPGVAVGRVVQLRESEIAVNEFGDSAEEENEKLSKALREADSQLSTLYDRMMQQSDAGKAAIFQAHRELLTDPELLENVRTIIGKGRSAAFAWKQAVRAQADVLSGLKNELLAARANDLRDIERRVLLLLVGKDAEEKRELPDDAILIAQDLTPSDTAALDRKKVVGFCTVRGGATSHVAILARTLSLPAIAGIDAKALDIPDGTIVIMDGRKGTLRLHPGAEEIKKVQAELEREQKEREENLAASKTPAVTSDGRKIEVAGNIGGVADAEQVVALGGEGVGLLRSEFLFLQRELAPTQEEQADVYGKIADILGKERSLIVRTLDVGGDKPLPYLPVAAEDNPFLGVRGIRLCLRRPEIFRTQVRAILSAGGKTRMRIMFPMVTTLDELKQAKAVVEEERVKLKAPPVEVGIMVEVPAAAVMSDVLAEHADFFSIGTNDLTQYVLAMDRGNAELGRQADGLEPAVLRMIDQTVRGAEKYGRFVGVCGGLAGEEAAVPLLVGLGVSELSVAAPAIPGIKALVRGLSYEKCRELAQRALKMSSAHEVREAVAEFEQQR